LASLLLIENAKGASPGGAKPKPDKKEKIMEQEKQAVETCSEEPRILEEIQVEELAIDGICGVY
jgi:mycofactocin precursor